MITTINEFKQFINESIGDITLSERRYEDTYQDARVIFDENFMREPIHGADWAGITAWCVSGEVWDGYFIVDNREHSYTIQYDLIHRYDDEDDNTQSDVIASLDESNLDVIGFLNKAKEYLHVNEGNDFDAVAQIGKFSKEIKIEVLLKHSFHSMERQGRASEYIKNSEIKETVELATEQMVDLLINNTLNVGDAVWIYNSKNDLNVVGSLMSSKNTDILTFKLITVMFHKNFNNKHNTYKITI